MDSMLSGKLSGKLTAKLAHVFSSLFSHQKMEPCFLLTPLSRIISVTILLLAGPSLHAKRAMIVVKNSVQMELIQKGFYQKKNYGLVTAEYHQALGMSLNPNQVEKVLPKLNSLIVDLDADRQLAEIKRNTHFSKVEVEVKRPLPFPISQFNKKALAVSPKNNFNFSLTPWGILGIKAPEAWNISQGGRGARVLILDTGIDRDHPSVRGSLEQGKDFVEDNQEGYSYKDTIGHGTHVSGTIAGVLDSTGFSGVAPNATLLMGRVCAEDGCSNIAIAEGVNWGIEQKVDVINMSLGGSWATLAEQIAIESATNAGITVVAATGNDGVGNVSYPAALPNCIAVGAVDSNFKRADFSQYGPELAIMAPGVDVVSSVPLGKGRSPMVRIKLGDNPSELIRSTVLEGGRMITTPESYELVYAGLGKEEDFKGIDVAGKVALIQRGDIKFSEKVNNAIQAQAKGVIIYNNTVGLLNGSIKEDGSEIPVGVFFIEQSSGERLKESLSKGEAVSTTYQVEVTNHDHYNGTSMATPHVSGVVALMKAANKNLTPQQVKLILQKTARPLVNASANSELNEYGAGLVNAEEAVSEAKNFSNQ